MLYATAKQYVEALFQKIRNDERGIWADRGASYDR